MWQTRAYKEMVVGDGHMLDCIFEFHQQSVLDKLRLQKGIPINRAVEKSLEAQIPEEVPLKLLVKEIFAKVARKIVDNCAKLFRTVLL